MGPLIMIGVLTGGGVCSDGAGLGLTGARVSSARITIGLTGAGLGLTGAGLGLTGAGVGFAGGRVGPAGAGVEFASPMPRVCPMPRSNPPAPPPEDTLDIELLWSDR